MPSNFNQTVTNKSLSDNTNTASTYPPLVSFGLPVRNGEQYIRRILDSLRSQDFSNLEIVICDNVSTDNTHDICQEYANLDERIRFIRNEENIGQIENFNKVLKLSRGKYFRWVGVDDWLEPDYASQCVNVLDNNQDAIGVTTYQSHHDDGGNTYYSEYMGTRLESDLPHERFIKMIWFLRSNYTFIDPIYTMMRREVLMRSKLLQVNPATDKVLAAELSLIGNFLHIPNCLAHRRKATMQTQQYHLTRTREIKHSVIRECLCYMEILRSAKLTKMQRFHCRLSVLHYSLMRQTKDLYTFFRVALRRLPGYSKLVKQYKRSKEI
jgi:glycosyltransferase involved in cell wall biosynthesis